MNSVILTAFLCCLTLLAGGLGLVTAGEVDKNTRALQNIHQVRVYYDVNIGEPKILATRLMLIAKTFDQLKEAGIEPQFVVGFRGKASLFVTKGNDYVPEEQRELKSTIQGWVEELRHKGVSLEQCLIATGFTHVDPEDILGDIQIVENGYISMIGYQTQGFSQIPMD